MSLRITCDQLARLCGVSVGTVDRALKDRGGIRKETKERILAVAALHGWRPRNGNSKLDLPPRLGIVAFDLNNAFLSETIACLEGEARRRGFSTLIAFSRYDGAEEAKCIRQMAAAGVEGILLFGVNSGEEYARFLRETGIPVVALGNDCGVAPYVGADDRKAMREAAESLKRRYGRILYYSPALRYENAFAQRQRRDGFWDACPEGRVLTSSEELKREELGEACLLCSTDYYAAEACLLAPRAAVFGFDGAREMKKMGFSFPSVVLPVEKIAAAAVEGILSAVPQRVILPHRIPWKENS